MGNGFLVAYYLAKKVGKSTLAHPTQVCPMNYIKKPARNIQMGEGGRRCGLRRRESSTTYYSLSQQIKVRMPP